MDIAVKRVYDKPANRDGRRVLVDRLWPRGVKKEDARLTGWAKDLAPSDSLRKWFGHDPDRWDEFRRRYFKELNDKSNELSELAEWAEEKRLTLLFGAKDTEHNNAVALREYLQQKA